MIRGIINIFNKGQWYDKQTFITSKNSFHRKDNEIKKLFLI